MISASVRFPDLEVHVHQLLVRLGGALEHLLAPVSAVGLQVGRDRLVRELLPWDASSEKIAFISIRSTMPLNFSSAPIGMRIGKVGLQPIDHHLAHVEEVGADAVHLVDECESRHLVLVGLAPDRLGLRLNAATAQNTATAPSSTRMERSTSIVKSTWPGVSMMLMRCSLALPFQKQLVAAEVIVMPRSCSCSIQSIVAAPSCTSPILWMTPV